MKNFLILFSCLISINSYSYYQSETVDKIIEEATDNSQLELLAHELFDLIGPRLVGTPQMKNAHDWAKEKYETWGMTARLHKWGVWRGWERGITHIDMLEPRIRTLAGRQLAWSPSTSKRGITADVVKVPEINDKSEFETWLKTIKGKFVLVSQNQITGRPDYQWEEYATPESFEKMKEDRDKMSEKWFGNVRKTGYGYRDINQAFEDAGAVGLISSYWSKAFGANKIFSARTEKIPNVDLNLEDYTMLYRMVENGTTPSDGLELSKKLQEKILESTNRGSALAATVETWRGEYQAMWESIDATEWNLLSETWELQEDIDLALSDIATYAAKLSKVKSLGTSD